MRSVLSLVLVLAFVACGRAAALNDDSTMEYEVELPDSLGPFKCVVDTLNCDGDGLVHSEYFLYDITGDGKPEMWVKIGSCEADTGLWVYAADNGRVRKIYSDYGGHTDFFLKGNTLYSVTCNMGEGYVSVYRYEGEKIKARHAEFSMWNNEGEIRAVKKKEQPIVDMWGDEDKMIDFLPLK